MARENNEEEAKKNYLKRQKANEDEKNVAMEKAAHQYNGKKELPDNIFHGHKELATKIRLWHQQGEKCLYTGKNIAIADLIQNQYKYEIDHILPLSLSFDDSMANKVLVLATANQEKGQRTPFQSLDSMDDAWSYREFKSYVKSSRYLSKKKKDYLLNEEDISKVEVKQKFIERNLVDTRYSSRVVLNTLQDFYKSNDFDTKVSVVRGQFTSQLRRKWRIDKTRETYHHHAVDALIIAASSQLRLWGKRNNPLISYKENQFVDSETGEIITLTDNEYKELVFRAPYDHFVDTISSKKFEDSILFSYQVDSKYNRKISDATIYSTRKEKLSKDKSEVTYVIGKIKDIYSQAGYDAFIKIYKKDKSKFLMYQKDPKTFEKVIEEILRTYPDKEVNENGKEVACNPFEKYKKENGLIRKYSKKGNGPEIKSLKYYDNKLGNHINITPDNSKNLVVLQSLKPWRTDVYFNHESKQYDYLNHASFIKCCQQLEEMTEKFTNLKVIIFPSNEGYLYINKDNIENVNIISEYVEHFYDFTFMYERFINAYPSNETPTESQFLASLQKIASYLFCSDVHHMSLAIQDIVTLKILNRLYGYDKHLDFDSLIPNSLLVKFLNDHN